MPRTALPTNRQYFVPRVIEIRIDPWDRLGIFKDTADAILAAVRDRLRASFTTFVAAALVNVFGAIEVNVVDVEVDESVGDELLGGIVVVTTVVVLATVVVAGKALKNGTATAVFLLICELSPSWPKSFNPQHRTSPSGSIAHA
jgi:hypothetical protein